MFILPYFHAIRKTSESPIHMIHLFLGNGGSSLLEIQDSPQDFCNENDIPILKVFTNSDVTFVKVDTATLKYNDFYTFHESSLEALELWKTFLWVGEDANSDPWNSNEYFKTMRLSGTTVYSVLETIILRSCPQSVVA